MTTIVLPDGEFINQCAEFHGALLDAGVPLCAEDGRMLSPTEKVQWLVHHLTATVSPTAGRGTAQASPKRAARSRTSVHLPASLPAASHRHPMSGEPIWDAAAAVACFEAGMRLGSAGPDVPRDAAL